jgi:hypothetical protein
LCSVVTSSPEFPNGFENLTFKAKADFMSGARRWLGWQTPTRLIIRLAFRRWYTYPCATSPDVLLLIFPGTSQIQVGYTRLR